MKKKSNYKIVKYYAVVHKGRFLDTPVMYFPSKKRAAKLLKSFRKGEIL